MDARKWDAIQYVAPGQFAPAQRQRLEAFYSGRPADFPAAGRPSACPGGPMPEPTPPTRPPHPRDCHAPCCDAGGYLM